MSIPFHISVAQDKADKARDKLKQQYPRLPVDIINRSIETTYWRTLFEGTNGYNTKRFNTQITHEHFYTIAVCLVEESRNKSIASIEMILLDHNKSFDERVRENDTELVKGIRSIPTGILRIILKSTHALWTTS